ncbi:MULTISPECIES: LysM peptidoglycan-binding domain-containing protein [Streptomyces]|uniref:LysM peptidoglycan-binding domain-containing protein n=1 Tax=Streptomyces dengpaensis TaxID=2049881 RepID=A0ABM6SU58_9ACTN|nr:MULTISPECIES: transglycosylase family protein [Streptomyces]AVH58274.1 LysM peptidoglycan-binding domain-containing protein [Streptomyces dengpaensis]PIB08039.1 peptigoglycan-binding protein LysM [Streptomyces sp. HG99]
MLSGNGRHRRPRQAPALIVAAGVTGSAIAIPLLGATSASAADGTTWDRVAECESGGAWSANSGNGYYGGLQLTQEKWESYGGLVYAPSADQASRSQQIAVAEKILDDQGLVAWPTCGPLNGLSRHSGDVEVDTGVVGDSPSSSGSSYSSGSSDSSESSESSGSPAASGSSGAEGSDSSAGSSSNESWKATKSDGSSGASRDSGGSDTVTGESDESDKYGQNGDSSGTSTGAGRHRGGTADEAATDDVTDGRTDGSSGRHASRGSGASRDAADGSYTVRAGDNLWAIADTLDLEGGWTELYAENKETVGADPDLILPGQSLAVGVEPDEK